jgi:hypothetical protein
MRIGLIIVGVLAIIACVACYFLGYNDGTKQSPLEEDRRGQLIFTLNAYQAAQSTNWVKVQSFLDIGLLALTRDYDRQFGIQRATKKFASRFADAKTIADRIEKTLVPIEGAFGSNVTVRITE